jgi:hypothetical protein
VWLCEDECIELISQDVLEAKNILARSMRCGCCPGTAEFSATVLRQLRGALNATASVLISDEWHAMREEASADILNTGQLHIKSCQLQLRCDGSIRGGAVALPDSLLVAGSRSSRAGRL